MHWHDLLSVPFIMGGDDVATGLDCWGMAREVCRRAGLLAPGRPEVADPRVTTERVVAALVRINNAERIGDMLFSDPEGRGYPAHVASVVAPGWAISTTKRYGPHVAPLHRVACDYGAWRVA